MALHKSNVFLDISGWKYRYLPDEVRREIPRRLRGQFLFGTDYPMFDPEACLSELDALGLPDDVAKAVLHDNAAALLGT
jgi:predicted TIM-barrel fold metal-dependent hydrolase